MSKLLESPFTIAFRRSSRQRHHHRKCNSITTTTTTTTTSCDRRRNVPATTTSIASSMISPRQQQYRQQQQQQQKQQHLITSKRQLYHYNLNKRFYREQQQQQALFSSSSIKNDGGKTTSTTKIRNYGNNQLDLKTATTTTTNANDDGSIRWKREVQELLELSKSSISTTTTTTQQQQYDPHHHEHHHWDKQAQHLLRTIIDQQYKEHVGLAFELLNQLIQIREQQPEQDIILPIDDDSRNKDILNDLLLLWRNAIQDIYDLNNMKTKNKNKRNRKNSSSSNHHSNIIKQEFEFLPYPSQLLSYIDEYRKLSSSISFILSPPTIKTYNILLQGSTNYIHNKNEGILLCNSLLDWLLKESKTTDSLLRPDSYTFQIVMKAWIQLIIKEQQQHQSSSSSRNAITNSSSNNKTNTIQEAIDQCERIAHLWVDYDNGNNNNNNMTMMNTYDDISSSLVVEEDETYNNNHHHATTTTTNNNRNRKIPYWKGLIQAYSVANMPQLAEKYLNELINDIQYVKHVKELPDTMTWNWVISSYAKNNEPNYATTLLLKLWDFHNEQLKQYHIQQQDEQQFLEMGSNNNNSNNNIELMNVGLIPIKINTSWCKPNVITYSSIIEGYAKVENGIEAERILQLLRNSITNKPTIECYTATMKANINNLDTVSTIMEQCLDDYKQQQQQQQQLVSSLRNDDEINDNNNDSNLQKPSSSSSSSNNTTNIILDTTIFNTWLLACAKIGSISKAKSILLNDMIEYNIKPNNLTYSYLLQCYKNNNLDINGATEFFMNHLINSTTSSSSSTLNTVVTDDNNNDSNFTIDNNIEDEAIRNSHWISTIVKMYDEQQQQNQKEDNDDGSKVLETLLQTCTTTTNNNNDNSYNNPPIIPIAWNHLLSAFPTNPNRLETILTYMVQASDDNDNNNNNNTKRMNNNSKIISMDDDNTAKSYFYVLRALADISTFYDPSIGERAESLLRQWLQKKQQQDLLLVENYYQRPAMTSSSSSSHEVLNNDSDHDQQYTTADLYTSVMLGWAKTGNVERTITLFDELYDIYRNSEHEQQQQQTYDDSNTSMTITTRDHDLKPTRTAVTAVLLAYSKAKPILPEQAEAFLQKIHNDTTTTTILDIEPHPINYNIVLKCWSDYIKLNNNNKKKNNNHKRISSTDQQMMMKQEDKWQRAEAIFEQMESPDLISYNTLAHIYVMCGQFNQAERLVRNLMDDHKSLRQNIDSTNTTTKTSIVGNNHINNSTNITVPVQPDLTTIRTVLIGLGRGNAADRAESFLFDVRDLYESNILDVCPNWECYRIVLQALAKSGSNRAGIRADALLQDYERRSTSSYYNDSKQSYDDGITTTTTTTTTTANYDELFPPVTSEMYRIAIKAQRGNANCAEDLLHRMVTNFGKGNQYVKPDRETFELVLDVIMKSGGRNKEMQVAVAERAEAFLLHMLQLYESGQLETALPTSRAYNYVMQCWSNASTPKFPQAGERAQLILRHMMQQHEDDYNKNDDHLNTRHIPRPTPESFHAVITAWVKAGVIDRSVILFDEFMNEFSYDNTKTRDNNKNKHLSDSTLYRRVEKSGILSLHAILGACRGTETFAKRAKEILFRLEELNDIAAASTTTITQDNNNDGGSGNISVIDSSMIIRPTTVTYTMVLQCLAQQGWGSDADNLLYRMIDRGLSPDVVCYNTVLAAWLTKIKRRGNNEDDDDEYSLQRIESIITNDMMMSSTPNNCTPDESTYRMWYEAITSSPNIPNKAERIQQVRDYMKTQGIDPTSSRMHQQQQQFHSF